jgi:tetratricopeptide (TPR) repeat protein
VAPGLRRFESERAARKEPQSLNAWEAAQRGWWHWNNFTKEDNEAARLLFAKAAQLDPRSSQAFGGLAWTHIFDLALQWTDSPDRSIAELDRAAQTSVALDRKDPLGQMALAFAYIVKEGKLDKAISACRLALQLRPSSALGHFLLGQNLARAGRPDEAIEELEKALRLSPKDPMTFLFMYSMAFAHFAASRYEDAVDWAQRSLERRAEWFPALGILAAPRR